MALLASVVGRGGVARAQEEDYAARVERAARCYAQLDYDCVLEVLEGFDAGEFAGALARERVELAGQILAVTFVIRGLPEAGRSVFADLLRRWPDYELEGEALAPRFFDVFYAARAEVRARALAPLADDARAIALGLAASAAGVDAAGAVRDRVDAVLLAIAIPDPGSGPGAPARAELRLVVGAGYPWLAGADRDVWDDAAGLSARVGTDALLGLDLHVAVDYVSHALTLDNVIDVSLESLSVLDLSLNIGYPVYIGPARFAVGAGAGYSTFGHRALGERGGLLFDVFGGAGVRSRAGVGVALEVRGRFIVVDDADGFAVSSPVLAALHLTYELHLD